jgi:hypothetical protein
MGAMGSFEIELGSTRLFARTWHGQTDSEIISTSSRHLVKFFSVTKCFSFFVFTLYLYVSILREEEKAVWTEKP